MTAVERAIRAYCSARFGKDLWDVIEEPERSDVVRSVTAVIASLHDPDDAMMLAGIAKGQEIGYTDLVGVFGAMIDAAVSERQ